MKHLNVAAKEQLEKASRNVPDYVIELMAACLLGLGRPDEALKTISRIPVKARRPYVRWREAQALSLKGCIKDALEVLDSCLERDKRSRHKTLLKMAKLYFENEEYQKVIECSKKASQFFKSVYQNPLREAIYLEALARFMLGEADRARDLVNWLKRDGFKYPGFRKNYTLIMGKSGGNA